LIPRSWPGTSIGCQPSAGGDASTLARTAGGAITYDGSACGAATVNNTDAIVVTDASGTQTLKDAMNEAIRDWATNVGNTFYCIGSVAGPHPYPQMVRTFQSVIGREAKAQILAATGKLPAACVACVGGGSNAMGLFHEFIPHPEVRLVGVEAAGLGIHTGKHAASLGQGRVGVLHGSKSYVLMDADGQIQEAHSISAGLDYPGVGPEHAWLNDTGRAGYVTVTDEEAVAVRASPGN